MLLYKLDNLIEGEIIKRPSKFVRSPYVADVLINTNENENENEVLAHTASLGCCGLVEKNSKILMTKNKTNNTNPKNEAGLSCSYSVYLSITENQIIGVHPKLAEKLVESALTKNCLSILQNIKKYKKETTIRIKDIVDSRFDFTGIDENNIPFIMEVKNVPLADYEDVCKTERKKYDFSNREPNTKVAYFPDGYRKKTSEPVSPRALKHIKELTLIKDGLKNKMRCIMCYVIQRTDVNRFQPSVIDPEYREAFKHAMDLGVEIITMVIRWNKEGDAYFVCDNLPITPFE